MGVWEYGIRRQAYSVIGVGQDGQLPEMKTYLAIYMQALQPLQQHWTPRGWSNSTHHGSGILVNLEAHMDNVTPRIQNSISLENINADKQDYW